MSTFNAKLTKYKSFASKYLGLYRYAFDLTLLELKQILLHFKLYNCITIEL